MNEKMDKSMNDAPLAFQFQGIRTITYNLYVLTFVDLLVKT